MSQTIVLEGASLTISDPSVDPTLVLLKTDLVNLAGVPVQRQEIRLEHRFLPVAFTGSKTLLGRVLTMITDTRGHAEVSVVAGAAVDIFLTNTLVSRQVTIPQPRSGTGDTVGSVPTNVFHSDDAVFLGTDAQGIIEIDSASYVITRVNSADEIEVEPAIPGALIDADWSIAKIDVFSLLAVAPDQFQVSRPTFDKFAIRTTL